MEKLIEKEKQLIVEPIERFLNENLLKGFKNRKDQPVVEVNSFDYIVFSVDEDNSELREKIIIERVDAQARVWVEISSGDGSRTNNTITIFTSGTFILKYNLDDNCYEIEDERGIDIIDKMF